MHQPYSLPASTRTTSRETHFALPGLGNLQDKSDDKQLDDSSQERSTDSTLDPYTLGKRPAPSAELTSTVTTTTSTAPAEDEELLDLPLILTDEACPTADAFVAACDDAQLDLVAALSNVVEPSDAPADATVAESLVRLAKAVRIALVAVLSVLDANEDQ